MQSSENDVFRYSSGKLCCCSQKGPCLQGLKLLSTVRNIVAGSLSYIAVTCILIVWLLFTENKLHVAWSNSLQKDVS